MSLETKHFLLVYGEGFAECESRVSHFFEKNFLVRYDRIEICKEGSCSAESEGFWVSVKDSMQENLFAVAGLIKELQESGFHEISDLGKMKQGYESKLLHVITHMLDGFFGADTVFYNLEEDSHGLSESFAEKIHEQPEKFWMIKALCSSSVGDDQLDQIRRFEVIPES